MVEPDRAPAREDVETTARCTGSRRARPPVVERLSRPLTVVWASTRSTGGGGPARRRVARRDGGRRVSGDEPLLDLPDVAPAARSGGGGAGTLAGNAHSSAPLAVRMRPRTLEELAGQQHLLAPGAPLRRLVEGDQPMSLLLWGPPGTGKTTIASIVSQQTNRHFVEVSAVAAGVKEVRAAIDTSRNRLARTGEETVLFVDEVHRFTKAQQDALLPGVENRWVTLVAATTENPFFSVISPLLSRSLLLTLEPLTDDDVAGLIDAALTAERGLGGEVGLDDDAREHLVRLAGGDARRGLTYLEAAAGAAVSSGAATIDLATTERAVDRAAVRYDRQGDQHYDVTSAFIKSVRGSDADAALHYLARMIEAGEDPRFIARRLVILASEDVGLADPTALTTAVAAAQTIALIGMPEGRLTLAQATIALSVAPKSNAVTRAIDAAQADVRRGLVGAVPPHLRDAHYPGAKDLGHGTRYTYAHDAPYAVAEQQYAPDELLEARYYDPTTHGAEAGVKERWERVRRMVRGRDRRPAGRRRAGPAGAAPARRGRVPHHPPRGAGRAGAADAADGPRLRGPLGHAGRAAGQGGGPGPRAAPGALAGQPQPDRLRGAPGGAPLAQGAPPGDARGVARDEGPRACPGPGAAAGAGARLMRPLWFVAGAGAGLWVAFKARRAAEALTPEGFGDRVAGLQVGWEMFADEVRAGMSEKESELRARVARLEAGEQQRQLPAGPTDAPARGDRQQDGPQEGPADGQQ
ncbi:hypothetical protein LUZ63_020624 [Rhynchospora breviuscula]|uniref:AAA+ ATPase domain-containing protein n=1 Tax=Rhynchospora breviuscula TaxID=2022672 RepID=A0A9P9Z8I8_9POAL|nr:hypothetical protein LUZ63_020624 [Rhynchospora breviuscula]